MFLNTQISLSLCLSPQAGPPYLDPREDPSSGDAEVKVGNELGGGDLVVLFELLPRSIVGVKNGGEGLGVNKAGCLLHVGGRGGGEGRRRGEEGTAGGKGRRGGEEERGGEGRREGEGRRAHRHTHM